LESGSVRLSDYGFPFNSSRIEFAGDVNTWFVFVSTRNVSAIDISPLEQVAKEVNAELKAVVDSDKDQLCFFFVYST